MTQERRDILRPDWANGIQSIPGQTFEFRRTIILTKRKKVWFIQAGQNAKLNPGVK